MTGTSPLAIVGALVAVVAIGAAALLFVQGDDATQRLALLFALIGVIVPALLALLRSDQAARATSDTSSIAQALNGGFEARVRHANRITAAEVGSPQDAARAVADATIAATLSHGEAIAPDVLPILQAAGAGAVSTPRPGDGVTPGDRPGVDTGLEDPPA